MNDKPLPGSGLENQYAGNDAWNQCVAMCGEAFPLFGQQQMPLIDLLGGHADLAIVIFQRTGDYAATWINRKVPALKRLIAN